MYVWSENVDYSKILKNVFVDWIDFIVIYRFLIIVIVCDKFVIVVDVNCLIMF